MITYSRELRQLAKEKPELKLVSIDGLGVRYQGLLTEEEADKLITCFGDICRERAMKKAKEQGYRL